MRVSAWSDVESDELPGEVAEIPLRSWADDKEINSFDQFVEDRWAGGLSPEDFGSRLRLQQGIYGQRQTDVLAPWTELTLRAEASDSYLDWGALESFKAETGPGEYAT